MKNLDNFSINKKKVLFRADLNIPVIKGKIIDNSRIEAIKPSIKKLLDQQNKIFIISHFGRPKGNINKKYSKIATWITSVLLNDVPTTKFENLKR